MIDTSLFQGKTARYYTLGCKLNFSETSMFARKFEEQGIFKAKNNQPADLCLINTCSVTDVADKKCRQIIRRMSKENPNAFIVVTGCYAQLAPEVLEKIKGVSLVLGSNEKANLVDTVRSEWAAHLEGHTIRPHSFSVKTKDIRTFQHSCAKGDRTRYWLKVQDGCDYFCTYCTIPFARGNSRNPTIDSLVEEAKQVALEGGKEIVLTGVNIGDFGKTTGEKFTDLCRALDLVEGIERYRISSLEPDLISDELIEFVASSRAFMPHFHVPLQSGSDEILALMHRRYDSNLFRKKILRIKELMPQAFIGVDVMVGTRGETPERFEETRALLEELPVTQLHVFPYSERPGTAALKIDYVVSPDDTKQRSKILLELSDQKKRHFYEQHINKVMQVLTEKSGEGETMHGFTQNYIRVTIKQTSANLLTDNTLVEVLLDEVSKDATFMHCHINQ